MDYRKLLPPPDEGSFSVEDVQLVAAQLVEDALLRRKLRPPSRGRGMKKAMKKAARRVYRRAGKR